MAHLLIIELPGGNDTDLLRAAVTRGDQFSFLSASLAHYRRQPAAWALLNTALALIEVPSFDDAELERRVLALNEAQPIDAVLCLIETRLTEAARLAQRLGLRYLNPASASLLRDKFLVRQRLQQRGLEQPPFELATTNIELQQAVGRLGLPVLIKPADGYGSQNIVVLRGEEDLEPWINPLLDMLPSRADYGLGVRANDRLLVERYMAGRFIGCDTFTSAPGRHSLLGVHEKLLFAPPSFAMRGSTFLPNEGGFANLERYVFSVLDAVGFDCGAAHMELMLTADGPRLVEINPRLVGAKMPRLVGFALGRSMHADLIALHTGQALGAGDGAPPRPATLRWVVADEPGVLDGVDLPVRRDPRIRAVEILKHAGDPVRPPMENFDRIGYVMTCARERSAAEALADDFVASARVRLRGRE